MGDYIPAKLGFDDGESLIFMAVTEDYSETLVTFYRNGQVREGTAVKLRDQDQAPQALRRVLRPFGALSECS